MSLKDRVAQQAPESVLRVVRPLYYGIVGPFYRVADAHGLIGPNEIYSDDYYAMRRNDPWRSDAHNVAAVLAAEFDPDSVIDFGCAIGAYLEPFYEEGVTVKGVEGNDRAFEYAVVPETVLERHDLREPYETESRYDLVMCFEVAEHIPKRFADTLVDTLCNAGDVVVITAAPPGQGGTHHVNEQPREYWQEKFTRRGFEYDERLVERLRSAFEIEKAHWVPKNVFVFIRA